MTVTLLSATILGIISLFIYTNAKNGYKKGLTKSLIDLSVVLLSVFACVLVSITLSFLLVDLSMWVMKLIGVYDRVMELVGGYMGAISVMARILFSLLLYVPLFFVLRSVLNTVLALILHRVSKNKVTKKGNGGYSSENELFHVKHDKSLGVMVGAISGFLIAIVFLTPWIGTLKMADQVLETVEELPRQAYITEEHVDLAHKYANDVSVSFVYVCGGGLLYDLAARTTVYDHTISLCDEVDLLCNLNFDLILDEEFNFLSPTAEDIDRIDNFFDDMNRSSIMKLLSMEAFRQTMLTWESGSSSFGFVKPQLNGYGAVNEFLDMVFFTCSKTDYEYFEADIDTMMNLLRIFLECGDLPQSANYEEVIAILEENNTIQRVDEEIQKNPHMSLLGGAIDDMFMSIVATEVYEVGSLDVAAQTIFYEELSEALNSTKLLNGSVKMVALTNHISESFGDYGVYVPESLNNKLAEILDEKTEGFVDELTQEQIKELFDSYIGDNN